MLPKFALILKLFLASLAFFVLFMPTAFVPGDSLDSSWQATLNHLQTRHAKTGVDYVFSYGPLHQLLTYGYHPELFTFKLVLESLFKLAMVVLFWRMASELQPLNALLFWAFIILNQLYLIGPDSLAAMCNLVALLLPLVRNRWTWVDGCTSGLLLALFSLCKFTQFVQTGFGLVLLTCYFSTQLPRWRAAWPLVWFLGWFLLIWFGLHQSFSNLSAYIRGGLVFSSGYADAMALAGPHLETVAALVVLGCLTVCALRWPRSLKEFIGLLLMSSTCFIEWKHGFVRHDTHSLIFFAFVILVLPLMGCVGMRRLLFKLIAFAACLVGLASVQSVNPAVILNPWDTLSRNFQAVFNTAEYRRGLEMSAEHIATVNQLPRIQAKVGSATIDMGADCQTVALVNGLNLTPRPSVQSNNAFNAELMQRNAEFLRGPNAPQFYLLSIFAIDSRPPLAADALLYLELLQSYKPVLEEKSYHLFERVDRRELVKLREAEVTLRVEEILDLKANPGEMVTLRLNADYTTLGSLRKTAFRPPLIWVQHRLANGEWLPYRLLPSISKNESLIHPHCDLTENFAKLWTEENLPEVTSVRVVVEGQYRRFVVPQFTAKLTYYQRPKR